MLSYYIPTLAIMLLHLWGGGSMTGSECITGYVWGSTKLAYVECLALCLIHVGAQKICLEWTNHLTTPFTVEETKIQTGLLAWPLPTGPGVQTQCRWRGRASNPWLGLCICCCTLLPRTSQLPLPHLSPPILRALLCPHWLTLTSESLFKF